MKSKILPSVLMLFLLTTPSWSLSQKDELFLRTFPPQGKISISEQAHSAGFEEIKMGEPVTKTAKKRLEGSVSVHLTDESRDEYLMLKPYLLGMDKKPTEKKESSKKDLEATTRFEERIEKKTGDGSSTVEIKTISKYEQPQEQQASDAPEGCHVIALSFNILRDAKQLSISAALKNAPSDLKIESIYPTHDYLSAQYSHSNEAGIQGQGGFNPYGSITIHDTDTRRTAYDYNRPLIFGLVNEPDQTVVWNFLRQGQQHLDPGIVTVFIVVSFTKPIPSNFEIVASETTGQGSRSKLAGWKAATLDTTHTVKQFAYLHGGELPDATISFLKGLTDPQNKTVATKTSPIISSLD